MGDVIANQAKGRIREFADDAAGDVAAAQFRCYLLKTTGDADTVIVDHDDMAALIDGVTNVEADFTNYTNKVIQDADITVTVDDTNDRVDIDVPDQTWTSAGGTTDNTLTDAVFGFDPDGTDTDSQNIPISVHDFTPTTDGSDLTLQVATAGLLRAA